MKLIEAIARCRPEALADPWAQSVLAIGADHGVLADGSQIEQVLELTDGMGAGVVVDFVGEGGAEFQTAIDDLDSGNVRGRAILTP